jgi:beta-glucosidase
MTLDEKIAQLDMYHINHLATNGKLDKIKVDTMLNGMSTGSVHDFYPESAKFSNELQRYIIENSPHGIPVLFIEEALHGYQGNKGTAFPTPIAMGSMWDVDLMKKIGNAIGAEARSVGVSMVLAPTLGIGREPRWGRVQETYGEDSYHAARNAVAIIKGMQGEDLTADDAIVAEPKHFGIHSIPEGGKNTSPVYIGEREARTHFLYVFEKAFTEAGALGAMAAYHDWDGVPAAADPWLLKELLRKEWGFKGMVISDLGAIVRQTATHFTAETQKEAVANSIRAGLDMQFYDYTHADYKNAIKDALKEGLLTNKDIDRATSSVLYVKFSLGLFENPYVDTTLQAKRYHSQKNQDLALEAGEKSIVLLQNENDVLPINEDVKKIAVIGELADKTLLGGYSPKKVDGTSIIEAFENTDYEIDFVDISVPDNTFMETIDAKYFSLKDGAKGVYAEYYDNTEFSGVPVLTQVEEDIANYWHNLSPAPGVPSDNFSIRWTGFITAPVDGIYEFGIRGDDFLRLYLDNELVVENWDPETVAKWATKKIRLEAGKQYELKFEHVEFTENAGASLYWHISPDKNQSRPLYQGAIEAAKKADLTILVLGEKDEHGEGKDKTDLRLSEASRRLIDEVSKVKTPKVLVLQNGRPLVLSDVTAKVDAIVETWYAGEKSGEATVNILTGKVNPSGKLSISFPRSNGQIPIYYNRKKSNNGPYVDNSNKPLYAFGHGLSYSEFLYDNLKIAKEEMGKDDTQKVTVTITNSSDRKGVEVVQLYIQDVFSSVSTPVLQLKGFQRVSLEPNEQKELIFVLSPEDLSLWNLNMERVVESGEFKVMIGAASDDIKLESSFIVK